MLKEYLPDTHIQLIDKIDSWKESISICASPLLSEKLIEPRYVDQIFKLYYQLGPYFVIAPKIALPHARPEDGVFEQALSLLIVKDGVCFNSENDPVYLIIMLATKDSQSHLSMLSEVAELLSDDEIVEQLIHSSSVTDIKNIIYRY